MLNLTKMMTVELKIFKTKGGVKGVGKVNQTTFTIEKLSTKKKRNLTQIWNVMKTL